MNLLTRDRSTSARPCTKARATALITDAAHGGCAIAQSLAQRGVAVALGHARCDTDTAMRAIATIASAGGYAVAIEMHDSDEVAAMDLFDRTEDVLGRIDVLVDNRVAKVPTRGSEDELFDRYFGVELRGMVDVVREAAPRLRGGGAIVCLSDARRDGAPRTQAWMTPLAALEWLTCTFAAELVRYGVRINAIAPSADCDEQAIGEAVALLLGADGSDCNGQVFDVGAAALLAIGAAA